MKYIIDIPEDAEYGILTYRRVDGGFCTKDIDITETEQLTSDYINEHFSDLQDEAYQRGLEDGKKATWGLVADASSAEYQRGLDDAWEAARKIVEMSDPPYWELFDEYKENLFGKISASEAIEKLKAYEEKQNDKIEVGDEVAFHHDDGRPDTVVVVTYIGQDGFIDGMDGRGAQYAHKNPTKWTKTGRHFDIDKILEEMKE